MKPSRRSAFPFALAVLALFAVARPTGALAVVSPGDRIHDPIPSSAVLRPLPPSTVADANFNGLFVYTTPGAQPRWVRIQQSGSVVWGTIDVNSNFSMCSRTRLDGTVSGNSVSFTASLNTTGCPCGGPTASLSFLGTIDASGSINGEWNNTCGGHDVWYACQSCTPLPDNDPPVPIARVPGLPAWAAWTLALSLLASATAALRSARFPRVAAR